MAKRARKVKAKVKVNKPAELVEELHELFLREDTELGGRGIFFKAKEHVNVLAGSVDKNYEQLARCKAIVEELKELI